MMCETCLGAGVVLRRVFTGENPGRLVPRPCPECNGSGIAHCCEGLRPGNVAPRRHPMFDDVDFVDTPATKPTKTIPENMPSLIARTA